MNTEAGPAQPDSNEETRSLLSSGKQAVPLAGGTVDEAEPSLFGDIPIKAFLLAAAGNFFEYYDFGLLGYFTDEVGNAFFPSGSDELYTLEVFTIFAVGFIFRPFGGAVFGYIADKMGRAKALQIAILLMSLPTFLTGCIPTYDMIGWAAPIILCILRILQGLSQGGEVSSSYVFVYEVAPKEHRAFYLALMGCSSFGSLLASAMHVFFTRICTDDQLYSWGWRIPFYFGICLAILAFWAKKELKEHDGYQKAQERIKAGEASEATIAVSAFENPLVVAFTQHSGVILLFFFGGAYQHASNYIVWTFLPDYIADATMHNGFANDYAYTINCINILLTIPMAIYIGYFTDRIRSKASKTLFGFNIERFKSPIFLYLGYALTMLMAPILWYALSQSTNAWTDWLCQLLLGLQCQIVWGCIYFWYIDGLLPEQQTRVSLYGVGYNVGAAVFSGTASLIASALVDVLGSITGALCTGLWMSSLALCGLLTVIYVDFYFEFGDSRGEHIQMKVDYSDNDNMVEDDVTSNSDSTKEPNNDEMDEKADDTIVAV